MRDERMLRMQWAPYEHMLLKRQKASSLLSQMHTHKHPLRYYLNWKTDFFFFFTNLMGSEKIQIFALQVIFFLFYKIDGPAKYSDLCLTGGASASRHLDCVCCSACKDLAPQVTRPSRVNAPWLCHSLPMMQLSVGL